MNVVRKTIAERDGLDFVLSDETRDRMGDVIEAGGWDLAEFRDNPIALFGHSSSFPIGTWDNVRVAGKRLVGTLKLAARGTSARIDELISLVEQGILRAVSVGFVPKEMEAIDPKKPFDGTRFTKQTLLECSLVAVPANPAALQLAKSLNISDETLSLAFGEQALMRRKDQLGTNGKHAATSPAMKANRTMINFAQRIELAQNDLVAKRDRLTELTSDDNIDLDAAAAQTELVDAAEKTLAVLKAAEAKIGVSAVAPAAPAVARRPLGLSPLKEVTGLDLMVRAIVVRGISQFGPGNKSIDQVLSERYPGHEATAIVAKADQTLGTTTGSHWADDIVRTVYSDFISALVGKSVYPELRNRGIALNFDGAGTVSIPGRTAGTAGGGFVAEGSPIRVGKVTTTAVTLSPKKLGVIVAFSRELAKRSTPAIEAVVRQGILEDTSTVLDAAILDATAADTARPAGLLNGVSAAASGFGGGDFTAVVEDFKALLTPFYNANAADNITVIMNPKQGFSLSMMPGPGDGRFGWADPLMSRLTMIESTHATANRLIAIRNSDFVTANGDQPEFDVSEQATIHMEDTTPLEIVSGTGPTTADPVRSLWQTGSIGIRMIMDVAWKMRRTGMVQWIDTTTW